MQESSQVIMSRDIRLRESAALRVFFGGGCVGEGGGGGVVALKVHTVKRNENVVIIFLKLCFFFQESGSSKSSGKSPYSAGTGSMHVHVLVPRSYKCLYSQS